MFGNARESEREESRKSLSFNSLDRCDDSYQQRADNAVIFAAKARSCYFPFAIIDDTPVRNRAMINNG